MTTDKRSANKPSLVGLPSGVDSTHEPVPTEPNDPGTHVNPQPKPLFRQGEPVKVHLCHTVEGKAWLTGDLIALDGLGVMVLSKHGVYMVPHANVAALEPAR